MAPLNRSYSLPVSLSNPVSRLKALSGAASRDEVSENQRDSVKSPLSTPPLAAVVEGRASSSTYQRPSPESSFSDLAPSEEGSEYPNSKQSPIIVPHKRWSLSSRIKKTLSIDISPKNGKGVESASLEEERGRRRSRRSKGVRIKDTEKKKEKEKEHELTVPAPNKTYPPSTTPISTPIPLTLDNQASNLILGAIDRGRPGQISPSSSATDLNKRSSGAFAALGLKAASIGLATPSRIPEETGTDTAPTSTTSTPKASFLQPSKPVGGGSSRGPRAPSPFFRARKSREQAREREKSPEVKALKKDNYGAESEVEPETEAESVSGAPRKYRPQASAYVDDDSASDSASSQSDSESQSGSDDDYADIIDEDGEVIFDEETEKNTEANAVFFEGDAAGLGGRSATGEEGDKQDINDPEVPSISPRDDDQLDFFGEEVEQDPLGEGPNVVVPPQSLFQTSSLHQPKRRKSLRSGIELVTSRPSFARDRCTITLTHGDPDGALEASARDGDELFMISVKEDESKVDPKAWSNSDRAQKLRVQKERQTTALLLVKQVTGLLQRTRLNITVTCQFVHAKNARHMLLDLIDFLEPTMKSSVPVMVARRRLQRPLRKTNPANLRHSPRVSLASASIEKTASSKQEDEVMDVAESEKEDGKPASASTSGPNPPA
ncbi:uncharacterized protein L199_003505 [Kwoniella botswanensis]|uniref:uncharacterized protein n=1 Tax=Kwoniella botswanensis TaxID=1268659 RepID=UPI00315CCA04